MNAAGEQIPIQTDIVDLSDCDNDGSRLADFCKRIDVVQRVATFGKIDHQDVRAGRYRQGLDCVAQSALVAFFRLPAEFDHHRTKDVEGVFITDIGRKRIAVSGQTGFQ